MPADDLASPVFPQAARNGAVYGAKIRFPHALVMTFLFGRGTPREKLRFILTATRNHSLNLMKFASLYKFIMILFRRTNGGKERTLDSFLAGLIGGWVVFSERTTVNEQVSGRRGQRESRNHPIRSLCVDSLTLHFNFAAALHPLFSRLPAVAQIVLYSCARCVSALLPRATVRPDYPSKRPVPTDSRAFAIFASLVWGSVMWLFENRRIRLQNGLVNSMDCEWRVGRCEVDCSLHCITDDDEHARTPLPHFARPVRHATFLFPFPLSTTSTSADTSPTPLALASSTARPVRVCGTMGQPAQSLLAQ